MNLIQSPEEHFRNLVYDYLKKKGLSESAETLLNESQLTGQIRADFSQHQHPHGFLYGLWTTFCDKFNSKQQIPGYYVSQSQAPNIGSIMETTTQMLREEYSTQLLSSFPSGLWRALSSCDFSSDGKIVASGGYGGGNKPFLCNLEDGASVTASESHSKSIFEVRFQPGSTKFATSADSKTVKLWNADSLEGSVLDVGHKGTVTSLDFHPSGGILCSCDTDDVFKVSFTYHI
ncbi:hypothetical protein TSUD_64280 [Trifolium subterraneum]|uniref:LisH domain-containing protein n=1 Tax=Trifolium subterraneum TaxID=3900 RepID=A0A2Z6MS35_TRISU|nr:hypothetical protein TSUD_64280 [Trifolium subterraneum]